MVYLANVFFASEAAATRRYSRVYSHDHAWKHSRILAFAFVLASISCCFRSAKANSDRDGGRNYHRRESVLLKTTRDANSQQNRRFGWLKVKPLWMDIENSCFARTCVAPYAVQVISIEPAINHTAMFNMDIEVPMPPVDMYFPTPPFKLRSLRKATEVTSNEPETASTTANFSVGLFGVDPTYRFPRHCHSMIENSATFAFVLGGGKHRRPPLSPPPSIISFGADCLNLTFQIFFIPAISDSGSGPGDGTGHNEPGSESPDNLDLLGAAAASDAALSVRTPVPMWIVAILAGTNAALIFAVAALIWHVALSAKKKRNKRLRRQRSSATATTNSYVPSCTTPMNRRVTPPLPPPPLRPPPSRSIADCDQQEPKYDVPWTESKFERSNGENERYRITFSTLPHKQSDPQFFNYYFSADQHLPQPVIVGSEMNSNDRPRPLRRTTTPSTATTMR